MKISLDDRKVVLLVAASFSVTLAFLILRALLMNFSGGIIEAIDIQWNQNFAMFEPFFHTWNFYNNGSNIIFASQFHLYGWVLVFKNVALAQRFVYFLTISLISFNMFLVAFHTLKSKANKTYAIYLASIIASIVYTLSPLLFSEIFHISFLWSYALFPLVFYFSREAFDAISRRKVIVSALLLSVFFAFMADAWGMLVGLLIVVFVAFSSAVLNGRKNLIHRFTPNFLLTALVMGVFTLLLASFWFLPYVLQRASEPTWDPFSVAVLVRNSQESGFTNILGLHSWIVQPFFDGSAYGWNVLTLLLPAIAILAVLVRRNKLTLTLSGLLAVGLFLATGYKYSAGSGFYFGEFYKWLVFYSPRILPNQAFLLKYPNLFLAVASLAVALLTAVLVIEIFREGRFSGFYPKRLSKKLFICPVVIFLSLVSLIAFIGAPLLSGNLKGALNPVTLPDQYTELNEFFNSQPGSFRVMYVPQEAQFYWSNNDWANKIEYWGSGAPPLMYGWGISASQNTGYLGDLIYDYLSTNQTQYLGKLLALGNVRFIVFHNDVIDPEPAYNAFDVYSNQYRDYFNSFLDSSDFKHFLSMNVTENGYLHYYLNETYFLKYFDNYKNSSEYQKLFSPEVKAQINSFSSTFNMSLEDGFRGFNDSVFVHYKDQYENTSNFSNSMIYLNNTLHSDQYTQYLNNMSSLSKDKRYVDSPIYNNSHNYLNSAEYLILTGSEYFANSTENKDFINSVEYRAFLDYYLLYSNKFADFKNSAEYANYQTYLNNNLNNNLNYGQMIKNQMFKNLLSQKDLKLLQSLGGLFVFENTEKMGYFQAYSKVNLVVGGLDTIGSLSSISDFYLNDSSFLFLENQHMPETDLAQILNLPEIDKTLIFYDNKTIDDLVLDTIDAGAYVAPGDIYIETSTQTWLKDVVTSYSWTPLTLGSYSGQKYDFGLGHNILYTTNNGSVNLPIKIEKSGEHSIWSRVLFSPKGGNLTFSIDNDLNKTISTNSPNLNGFKWVNLTNTSLSEGSHTLTITSDWGPDAVNLNAVNLVALPTVADLEDHRQNLIDSIAQSNTQIAYVFDKQGNLNSTVSLFAPQSSLYRVSYMANQTVKVKVDNTTIAGSSTGNATNWYSSEPFNLNQDFHNITFSANIEKVIIYSVNANDSSTESLSSIFGNGAQPYVVSYEKTDPVSFSVDVNASKPFILGFQEPHDEFWQSTPSMSKIIINSVNNGFLVDSNVSNSVNGTYSISLTYGPEKDFQLGIKISAVALVLVTFLVVALSVPAIYKRLGRISMSKKASKYTPNKTSDSSPKDS
jgi:hypothetical protein